MARRLPSPVATWEVSFSSRSGHATVSLGERHDDKRLRARLKNGAVIIASRAWSRTLRGEAS